VSPWESLLAAAQTGAEWAWDRIYRDLAPPVRGYLVAHGAVDPDDLLGEVWLQVARNIGTFAGDEAGFRSWVFMVAHHRLIDERRRRARRPGGGRSPTVDGDPGPVVPSAEEEALREVEVAEVRRLLAGLTDEQRQVLTLRILGDLTVEQVAGILGKRPGAVKALQRRALRALEKNLPRGRTPGGPSVGDRGEMTNRQTIDEQVEATIRRLGAHPVAEEVATRHVALAAREAAGSARSIPTPVSTPLRPRRRIVLNTLLVQPVGQGPGRHRGARLGGRRPGRRRRRRRSR
jgi:RNA polymerase sigma factor (sigma-70 family)